MKPPMKLAQLKYLMHQILKYMILKYQLLKHKLLKDFVLKNQLHQNQSLILKLFFLVCFVTLTHQIFFLKNVYSAEEKQGFVIREDEGGGSCLLHNPNGRRVCLWGCGKEKVEPRKWSEIYPGQRKIPLFGTHDESQGDKASNNGNGDNGNNYKAENDNNDLVSSTPNGGNNTSDNKKPLNPANSGPCMNEAGSEGCFGNKNDSNDPLSKYGDHGFNKNSYPELKSLPSITSKINSLNASLDKQQEALNKQKEALADYLNQWTASLNINSNSPSNSSANSPSSSSSNSPSKNQMSIISSLGIPSPDLKQLGLQIELLSPIHFSDIKADLVKNGFNDSQKTEKDRSFSDGALLQSMYYLEEEAYNNYLNKLSEISRSVVNASALEINNFRSELNPKEVEENLSNKVYQDNHVPDSYESSFYKKNPRLYKELSKNDFFDGKYVKYEKIDFKTQDQDFKIKLEKTQDRLLSVIPSHEQGQTAQSIGMKALFHSDKSSSSNQNEEAEAALTIAINMADIVLGFIPVVGFGKDIYEAASGKRLLTGENLSEFDMAIAVAGVLTVGIGSKAGSVFKVLKKINPFLTRITGPLAIQLKKSKDGIKKAFDYVKNSRIGDRFAQMRDLNKRILESAAKLFGKAAPEEVKNFAKLTTEIAGDGVDAIKEIEKIAETAGRTGKGLPLLFDADNAVSHFKDHSDQIMKVFNKSSYNLKEYMMDANHVVKTGQYSKELNAYVKVIGGSGDAKAAFVGLKNGGENISTFHIKDARLIAKKDPSLGWSF